MQNQNENLFSTELLPSVQNPFEEVGLHRQFCKTVEEMKLARLRSKEAEEIPTNDNVNVTPKAQKQVPSDVKRWASVVKAQKKIQQSPETNVCKDQTEEGSGITSEIFDCIFKIFPKSLENHKRFIIASKNLFFCNICCVELDSVISLSNHLKTRNHEDNVIKFFKEKLPDHLDHTLEFVSFYSSNLCCNLCRCRIAMSSDNPYETIVNIIGHNTDVTHASRKAEHETFNQAKNLLKSLTFTNLEIKDNAHFIENKMNPQFKCKLCNKNILYDENLEVLVQNFTSHFRTMDHIKNQKAVEILKLFGEASGGKDNFVVSNGIITCSYCNQEVETNLDKLISHVNGVEHAKDVFAKLDITSSFNNISEIKTTIHENKANEAKSLAFFIPKNKVINEKEKCQPKNEIKPHTDSRLNDLLNTLPSGMRHVDCLIENDKGSVTCLTCNRVVPPSTYNLRTHLLGSNHKKNEELKKDLKFEEVKSKGVTQVLQKNQETEEMSKDQTWGALGTTVKLGTLFRSLPGSIASINCIVKNDKNVVTCLICQCSVTPVPGYIHEHLMTKEHKDREKLWLNDCPGCHKGDSHFLKTIPKNLRVYKCHRVQQIPSVKLNQFYSLLLKKNSIVLENEHVLVKNVDGVNSYCKLCKSLIPLSMDFSVMEENIVLHLNGKRHMDNLSGQNQKSSVRSKNEFFTSCKVARSLFPSRNDKPVKDTKLQEYQYHHDGRGDESHNPFISIATAEKEHAQLPQEDERQSTTQNQTSTDDGGLTSDQKKVLGDFILSVAQKMYPKLACRVTCLILKKNKLELLSMLENEQNIKSKIEEIVKSLQASQTKQDNEEKELQAESSDDSKRSYPISDKADLADRNSLEISKNLFKESTSTGSRKALPVKKASRLLRFEAETDEEVLNRREKQIGYGKNTQGYSRYCQLMPRHKRSLHHPITPPKHVKCSRRTWDGMVRAWRRHLHDWDPPSVIDPSVHSDIKPLTAQDNATIKE